MLRAATITPMGPGGAGSILLAAIVLLTPFVLMQCGAQVGDRRAITKVTCGVLYAVAVFWMYFAWRTLPLDYGAAPILFARHSIGSLFFAAALAWSLNAEQVRTLMERH